VLVYSLPDITLAQPPATPSALAALDDIELCTQIHFSQPVMAIRVAEVSVNQRVLVVATMYATHVLPVSRRGKCAIEER
jgi:hypothetical protein